MRLIGDANVCPISSRYRCIYAVKSPHESHLGTMFGSSELSSIIKEELGILNCKYRGTMTKELTHVLHRLAMSIVAEAASDTAVVDAEGNRRL